MLLIGLIAVMTFRILNAWSTGYADTERSASKVHQQPNSPRVVIPPGVERVPRQGLVCNGGGTAGGAGAVASGRTPRGPRTQPLQQ